MEELTASMILTLRTLGTGFDLHLLKFKIRKSNKQPMLLLLMDDVGTLVSVRSSLKRHTFLTVALFSALARKIMIPQEQEQSKTDSIGDGLAIDNGACASRLLSALL